MGVILICIIGFRLGVSVMDPSFFPDGFLALRRPDQVLVLIPKQFHQFQVPVKNSDYGYQFYAEHFQEALKWMQDRASNPVARNILDRLVHQVCEKQRPIRVDHLRHAELREMFDFGNPSDATAPSAAVVKDAIGRAWFRFTVLMVRQDQPPSPDIIVDNLSLLKSGLEFVCKLTPSQLVVAYSVKMAEGKVYQIDMISHDTTALHPFLRLLDAERRPFTFADDSDGSNPRIHFRATASGNYTVIATSFPRGDGQFTLKITESG